MKKNKVNVDDLFERKASPYALVIGVAKRARQITKDYEDRGEICDDKAVLEAIEEIKDHKVSIYEPDYND